MPSSCFRIPNIMAYLNNEHIVLMPGLDGTGKSFEPVLPLIADSAQVTVVRYPTDRYLTFDETVSWAASQIPRGTAPVVIAESFSGPVAVRLVASGSITPKALVLCATFVRSPRPLLWRIARFLHLPLAIRADMPHFFFKLVIGRDHFIDALLPLWKKVHSEVPARIMDARLALINEVDVRSDLDKLALPCLYLQAKDDRIIPSSCLKDLARRVPHLCINSFDAPHFILQAVPEDCLQAIEIFLTQRCNQERFQ
jgi:pimeloyl-[acyl-carrier protein] methyl ester esterase